MGMCPEPVDPILGDAAPRHASLRRRSLVLGAAISLAGSGRSVAAGSRPQVHAELRRIAGTVGGRLGVSALAVKKGVRIQLDSGARYPMASTVKVAVAMTLLDQVDRRALSLSEPIEIRPGDLSPGSGEINRLIADEGHGKASTLGELLQEMMRVSDNTATDHLMARLGGPSAITGYLRALGVADIEVSRPTAQIVADSWGFTLPPSGARERRTLMRLQNGTPRAVRERAEANFLEDARDTATPDAMVALLAALVTGKALATTSTTLLLDTMAHCRTGPRRIKGQLPRAVQVAHKTGTLSRVTTNDVGIVTLPGGRGALIVAIFLTRSSKPLPDQEAAIATVASELYAHFNG